MDAHTGGHWCFSCHCKWPGNWGFIRFYPSTCVPLPLRPVCQWHSCRYGVRMCINLEKLVLRFFFNSLGTFHLNFLLFYCFSCMVGYINNTLSVASAVEKMFDSEGQNVTSCRFVLFFSSIPQVTTLTIRIPWTIFRQWVVISVCMKLECLVAVVYFLSRWSCTSDNVYIVSKPSTEVAASLSNIWNILKLVFSVPLHSYKDYRDGEYNFTPQFWLIYAIRFAFVILFEVSLTANTDLVK